MPHPTTPDLFSDPALGVAVCRQLEHGVEQDLFSVAAEERKAHSPRYMALGLTRDRDTCECCGKRGLTKAVILQWIDEEGHPEGAPVHFGTTCAGYAVITRETRQNKRTISSTEARERGESLTVEAVIYQRTEEMRARQIAEAMSPERSIAIAISWAEQGIPAAIYSHHDAHGRRLFNALSLHAAKRERVTIEATLERDPENKHKVLVTRTPGGAMSDWTPRFARAYKVTLA